MEVNYSVGVPVRNEEKMIVQTLESILGQSIQPREILVCINGSTDGTYRKVSDVAATENKINLITSSPGKANAWNKIVSQCSENMVMFCDGDVIVSPKAAENMIERFTENPRLAIVGASNAYYTADETTIFSRFFTEHLDGKPIKPDWVCGRLYMARLDELTNLARKLEIDLMPHDIINEDGFLEMLTTGYREIINSSYNLSIQVSSFHDWLVGFKRVLAGQKQLKKMYPQYYGDSDFSIKRLNNYVKRFNDISDWRKKVGVTSLFFLRTALNVYYKLNDNLDYNQVWIETESTKRAIRNYTRTPGF